MFTFPQRQSVRQSVCPSVLKGIHTGDSRPLSLANTRPSHARQTTANCLLCFWYGNTVTFIGVQLTRGLTSYGWSHKLRVVSQVTGGLTSYGWSHKLWVVSQVMGGLTSYGWSHKLWVVSQVMGGLTSYGWSHKFTQKKPMAFSIGSSHHSLPQYVVWHFR